MEERDVNGTRDGLASAAAEGSGSPISNELFLFYPGSCGGAAPEAAGTVAGRSSTTRADTTALAPTDPCVGGAGAEAFQVVTAAATATATAKVAAGSSGTRQAQFRRVF